MPDTLTGLGAGRPSKPPPAVHLTAVEDEWLDRLAEELAEKEDVLRRVRRKGIPDYKREEMRRKAADKIHAIHPDIAELKSLSLGHKFRMQAAINYRKAVRNLGADLKTEIDDLAYQLKHRIAYLVW